MNDLDHLLTKKGREGVVWDGVNETTIKCHDNDYLYVFGREDGHLALRYNRYTETVEYKCEHIKKGERKTGLKLG